MLEEKGSSLIWFSAVVTTVVAVILVLSSATHQYLFARKLKDYSEQLVATTLGVSSSSGHYLTEATALIDLTRSKPNQFKIISLTSPEDKTLMLHSCAIWNSPLPIIPLSRQMCVLSMAR